MLTKIDLATIALLKLGEPGIQSFNDDTASSKLALVLFDSTIESLIASHPWHFATKKIDLTKNTDGDFLIPTDVLRITECRYEIIGNKIKSPGEQISITAIMKTGPENFPGYFSGVAATKLAIEFCIPLVGDQNIFRMLIALYESELRAAKFIDSTMSVNKNISDFSLITARF